MPPAQQQRSKCPICACTSFVPYRGIPNTRCQRCKSNERTRVVKLFLDQYIHPSPGQTVLHLAPEPELSKYLSNVVGAGYEAADVDPERYSARVGTSVKRLDLCQDTSKLPSGHYDLVLHNHVLEHVPCNVSWVAQNLHRSVKQGGAHVFSIPISAGYYAEDLDPNLTEDERSARFGQRDHMRRFGRHDFSVSFGNLFGMSDSYSLTDFFPENVLVAANIRKSQWTCSGSSVFYIRKAARDTAQ